MITSWMRVGTDGAVYLDSARMTDLSEAFRSGVDRSDTAFVADAVRYAIAAEREACAKIAEAEGIRQSEVYTERDPELCADDIATAIRNRT